MDLSYIFREAIVEINVSSGLDPRMGHSGQGRRSPQHMGIIFAPIANGGFVPLRITSNGLPLSGWAG